VKGVAAVAQGRPFGVPMPGPVEPHR
jgi:hypothetical protein